MCYVSFYFQVRAFYEGRMVIENDKSKNGDEHEREPILPLTDAYAPNALRRRIFLEKLSKM